MTEEEEQEKVTRLRIAAANAIKEYHEALPEPKKRWHDYYYRDGGLYDRLESWHKIERKK